MNHFFKDGRRIVTALVIIAAVAGLFYALLRPRHDPDLSVAIVNNTTDVTDGTDFHDGFTSYAHEAGLSGTWQFDSVYFFNLENDRDFLNSYYEKLVARIENGEIDGMILSGDNVKGMARGGRVLDLRDAQAEGVMETYTDRIVMYTDDEGNEIPIGIDISDSAVLDRNTDYQASGKGSGTAVFAFSSDPPHPDMARFFLEYLLQT